MLVSPGLEITVTDEAQYVSTAVGTVPFVLLATSENKIFNGTVASYTTKANAGKLLAVTSQRELITNLGYPEFQQSSAGTPLHGNERNEYGLMAAYSALGVSNRMYIIRADIDLAQLEGTSVRPIGTPTNGTFWLDLSNTSWGVYEWNASTQSFVSKVPDILTNASSTTSISGILTPVVSVGTVGSYAVVASSPLNYVFYKRSDNIWVQVGSLEWQKAFPAVTGTVLAPVLTPNSQMVINSITVTVTGSTLNIAESNINSANIPGVTAKVVNNAMQLYVTSEAMSDGTNVDGKMTIIDGTSSPASTMGLQPGTYFSPAISYGGYTQVPDWRATDPEARPTGSVWVKTSVLGSGTNLSFKTYDEDNNVWTPVASPIYKSDADAIFSMDPNAGGFAIQAGTIYIREDVLNNGTVTFRPFIRQTQGAMKVVGTVPNTPMVFTSGDAFTLYTTQTGTSLVTTTTITVLGTAATDFVSAILAANIPEVSAELQANGAISIIHKQGGAITMGNVTGTPLTVAGFTLSTNGIRSVPGTSLLAASNFAPLVYTYSVSRPYTAPVDGTLWFYNNLLDVDVMINETTGWKGYQNVSRDARGYNLVNTDPAGVIMSSLTPTTQSDNTPLVPGDLWINTSDLENFPVMSRWNGSIWNLIDNTDVVSQNGVVFADARWDASGTLDPAAGALQTISSLLTSDYIDLDCPDHRLYPRGTLLFNLRRSGFNVKHYVSNYFNETAFPSVLPALLPQQRATWITSSGLQNDGSPYMGHKAQRIMIIKALRAAIDGNEMLREESFVFNLLACPGYPELITNMVQLNNDRKNTGFIIGDTPLHLKSKIMDVTAWSTDANGDGLATADPYMAVYYPHGLSNDLQGNTIVVPASHMILRAAIRSDNVSYPWFSFAGTRRGLIDNATDIGYIDIMSGAFVRNGINQGLRDTLYQLNINPVTLLPGVGLTNFGNKTRNGVSSSMDRINVARLINYIRTILSNVGDGYLFEPNDAITRNQIKLVISSALNDLIAKRGVYDYLVICDESNNDNGRISRNELYVDIAIEPMKDVEFIYIPIRLKNPGDIKSGGK